MKRLTKSKIKEMERLGKAAELTHMLTLKVRKELFDIGLDENLVLNNLNSLLVGDMSTSDFIKVIQEEIDYLYN